jgi:hypothetical protein
MPHLSPRGRRVQLQAQDLSAAIDGDLKALMVEDVDGHGEKPV